MHTHGDPPARLILGSTSRYRRQLLERLRLPFATEAPDVDESPGKHESPPELVSRLALAKATAIATRHPGAWVIGSDQVAVLDGRPLGKPGGHPQALAQLQAMSGRPIQFLTAVSVANAAGLHHQAVDVTTVGFRQLATDEIERYLQAESPYDCAGSFKSEGLGIALFDSIESRDPTALIGLPLIATAALLRQAGFLVP